MSTPLWASDTEDDAEKSEISSVSSLNLSPPHSSPNSDQLSNWGSMIEEMELKPACIPPSYDTPAPSGSRVQGYVNIYDGDRPGCYRNW